MLLLVQRFSDKLGRGGLPIVPRRLIHVWKVVSTVAVMWHYAWPIFHFEVGLTIVPEIILAGLCVQLILLLITKLDSQVVCRRVRVHIEKSLKLNKELKILILTKIKLANILY